jgi:hypothetical protein
VGFIIYRFTSRVSTEGVKDTTRDKKYLSLFNCLLKYFNSWSLKKRLSLVSEHGAKENI